MEKLTIRAVGGPTAVLDLAGLRILTDPTFDPPGEYERPEVTLRKTEGPAISADEIGDVDVVLLSHDHHSDNLDDSGREFLPRARTVITTVEGAERLGHENAVGLEPWTSVSVGPLGITAVPAHHGPEDKYELIGPVIGFVLKGDDLPTVYVSGDNASVDVVRSIADRVGDIDVAILFAGGAYVERLEAYVTLKSEWAAEAARALDARAVIALHHSGWGHFTQDLDSLQAAFAEAGLADRLVGLEPGESVTV
jgi:L-ascorbate metabolism protein UlaG (beta-lactamase superfamily)